MHRVRTLLSPRPIRNRLVLGSERGASPRLFSTEEPAPPLQPSRAKVNERATALLDRHGESILRLAYSYLHNQSDAEDILQDTLIQYLRTAPVLESPAHEKAWLLRVAGNLSKNLLRAQGYRQADQLEETLVAQEREDLSYVWDAVKALPVPYRETIHLFYYEGYSTAQIARILDQKESTVRSRLKRGREKLKPLLEEVGALG